MDRTEIRNVLAEAFQVAKEEEIDPALIRDDAHFRDDLGIDSLAVMEVIFEVEDRLKISIEDEDMQGVETVGQVIEMCERKLAEKE